MLDGFSCKCNVIMRRDVSDNCHCDVVYTGDRCEVVDELGQSNIVHSKKKEKKRKTGRERQRQRHRDKDRERERGGGGGGEGEKET